jgi:uncharacterized protein YlaI
MKAKCTVCGKEYEIQDGTPSAKFVEEHPERAKCYDCFKAGGTDKAKATKAASPSKSADKKGAITADVLRQSYDEVVAAFADVLDDVKDYLGGWTTTVALSKK